MLDSLGTLIVIPIFIIIMVVCKNAIQSGLKMTDGPSWTLAACVAALAIVGMMQPTNAEPAEKEVVHFLLVPYAALGISILLSMLLAFLFKHKKSRECFLRWFAKDDSDSDERMKR